MGRGSSLNKLERLDQLLGALKTGDAHTAQSLADDLGVSLRTLMRDLETLRDTVSYTHLTLPTTPYV